MTLARTTSPTGTSPVRSIWRVPGVTVGSKRMFLGSKSHLARHLGNTGEAVRLAQRGVTLLDAAVPMMKARLLALGARAFAASGESGECAQLLLMAVQALAQESESSPWTSPFGHAALILETAQAQLALGQAISAAKHAVAAVSLRSGDRTRRRALAQLVHAEALIADHRAAEACSIILDVIEQTRSLSSVVVTRRLEHLQERLTAYRREDAIADSLRALAAALRERRWLYQWEGPHRGAAVRT
ncbi:hypothetical protein ACIBH1_40825 [Nonomuraea sp. NPDC050663]|uniref:hypothetical protein n=1 Tax=Nonomuraea sp. NPDC050663 TaxID=3364370 RepID=UPI0037AF4F57